MKPEPASGTVRIAADQVVDGNSFELVSESLGETEVESADRVRAILINETSLGRTRPKLPPTAEGWRPKADMGRLSHSKRATPPRFVTIGAHPLMSSPPRTPRSVTLLIVTLFAL